MFRKEKGFTLIEALIVVVIIGIIAAVAIPKFVNSKADSELATCQANLSTIQTAVSHYKFANANAIPADCDALVTADLLEVVPVCPTTNTNTYAIDGTTGAVSCSNGHPLPSG